MLSRVVIDEAVRRALEEDLAGGDLTTEATVSAESRARATATAKSPLTVCGAEVFARAFTLLDPSLRVEALVAEGTRVDPGTDLWIVEGSTRTILMAERTALNFAQRMSGIATQASYYVSCLPPGSQTRITDTRKTTPGLRTLERYAVRCGGAHNHRDNLGSAVLIKDNHIEAAGGVARAVKLALARAPHTAKVEVEVESLTDLNEALTAGAHIVMLDNFSPDQIAEAVRCCAGKALVEASGGITAARISELATAGVDLISVGALTHSVMAADISLNIEALTSASAS